MPGRGRGRVVSHQEENYQGIVLQTRVVSLQVSFLALRSVSVAVMDLLQPWYPTGWRGQSQGFRCPPPASRDAGRLAPTPHPS